MCAFPAEVTAQMVLNFERGGAAINQLSKMAGADLDVIALDLDTPTADFTQGPAMSEAEVVAALQAGWNAVKDDADLLVVGEMGIGNTTSAAALAGELLGEEQHGNIETIGFSLHMEMLEQAVEALKRGEQPDVEKPLSGGPELNLRIPALIPEDSVPAGVGRLTLYKRIAGCKTRDGLKELQVEMIDRFGLLPEPVKNLFAVTELRQQAERLGITRLDAHAGGGKLEFGERTPVDPLTIVKLVQSGPNRFKLEGANALRFVEDSETPEERIQVVQELLARLAAQSIQTGATG